MRGQLTLDDIWLIVAPLGLLVWLSLDAISPEDFWWHLRTGQIIAQTGQIPSTDLFTFTRAGQPWTNQPWLTQVLFYALYRLGQLPLILFYQALTIAAGYALLERACLFQEGVGPRDAGLATLAAMALGSLNWGVRPQVVSFLCFGALVFLLERHRRRGGRSIWSLPALFALWANLHGGFVFGGLLLAVYVAARVADDVLERKALGPDGRHALVAAVASLLALGLNPGGPTGIARYVAGFPTSTTTLNRNMEFLALSIRERDGTLFFLITIAFLLLVFHRQVRLPRYHTWALIVFGVASLYARRILPWFGMAAAPALALALAWRPQGTAAAPLRLQGRVALNYLMLGLMAAAVVGSLPWVRPLLPGQASEISYFRTRETPVEAGQALCSLGSGTRAFNDIGYGSYLAWACPDVPVFMDTRFELYPTEMWEDYMRVAGAAFDWEAILARYDVDTLLLRKDQQKRLVEAARGSAGWTITFEDDESILMQRTDREP